LFQTESDKVTRGTESYIVKWFINFTLHQTFGLDRQDM